VEGILRSSRKRFKDAGGYVRGYQVGLRASLGVFRKAYRGVK
jgi:hypothetical protein